MQPDDEPIEYGGDAACWLSHVCPECGALVEGVSQTPCWRCGTVAADWVSSQQSAQPT